MGSARRAEHEQLHRVCAGELRRIDTPELLTGGKRDDLDDRLPGIMLDQCGMNALDRRAGGEIVEIERDLHDHALREFAD
ncbi:hypothetical protein D3C87_1899380 [compost metagenome]